MKILVFLCVCHITHCEHLLSEKCVICKSPGKLILADYRPINLAGKVFAYGPGDLGSMPGRVIPKTPKMVLDTSLLNTQHYKGKVEQSREKSNALPYTLVYYLTKMEPLGSPRLRTPTLLFLLNK